MKINFLIHIFVLNIMKLELSHYLSDAKVFINMY